MPADRQGTAQKRGRLPFKPPRRTLDGEASTAASSARNKKPISRKSTGSTSKQKTSRKSTLSSKRRTLSPAESELASSGSDSSSGSESSTSAVDRRDREQSLSEEPDYILAEIITSQRARGVEASDPAIPEKLLTTLLHHHFQNPKTKIAKDANAVVAKYIDIFVREALARAAYERTEADNADGGPVRDGFLEVEDLEKLAPQMALDF